MKGTSHSRQVGCWRMSLVASGKGLDTLEGSTVAKQRGDPVKVLVVKLTNQ